MIGQGGDVSSTDRLALDVLSLFSRKWNPVVVLVLLRDGPLGFNELLERIPDLSGKVLTGTLGALRDAGLVERTVVSESPLRVEYDLTPAGRDMQPIFDELVEWGGRHLESATSTVLLADADRRITGMYEAWLTDRYTVFRAHNGDELATYLDDTVEVVLVDEGLPGIDPRDLFTDPESTNRSILLIGDRPDVSLLEIGCDDVLRKPVVRETVLEAIDDQLDRQGEPPEVRERASLDAKLSLLESVHPIERLEASPAYVEATARLDELDS